MVPTHARGAAGTISCKTANEKCVECHDEKTRGIRILMKEVRRCDGIHPRFDSTTFAEVLKRSQIPDRNDPVLNYTI